MHALSAGRWLHRPEDATITEDGVVLTTQPGTDLWQRTYYGFRHDNAPALLLDTDENLCLTVRVSFNYRARFDQAGVLAWVDADTWVKAGIEREDSDHSRLGTVVTNAGYSDWSTRDVPTVTSVWFRLSRRGPDLLVEASLTGSAWEQLRVCHLHALGETTAEMGVAAPGDVPATPIGLGIYACSPEESRFQATFDSISLEPSRWPAHT